MSLIRRKIPTYKLFLLGSIVLASALVSSSQEKLRTLIDSPYKHANAPIQIVESKVGDRNMGPMRTAFAGKDWVHNLCFTVKNISSKRITFFEIGLVVPKSETNLLRYVFHARFSVPLFIDDAGKAHPTDKPMVLRPGETVVVSISEQELKVFMASLRKTGSDDFTSLTVDIEEVQFDDDTGWSHGWEWRRDPTQRNRKISLNGPSGTEH